METSRAKSQYYSISLGAVLLMAFVLTQPTLQTARAVGMEELPDYDDCNNLNIGTDPITMNTVKSGNIVKTVHAEKELYSECNLDQGNLEVIVDVTTYIEIYENIVTREVIQASALVTTCIKDEATAAVIDCESYTPSSDPTFVGSDCIDFSPGTPQEMNTVNKGNIAKTVETQKETFLCLLQLGQGTIVQKKVDIVLFTEIYENLATKAVEEVQFHSMRCVILRFDNTDSPILDGTVESCQFSTIQN
jgi:hypothetical protein